MADWRALYPFRSHYFEPKADGTNGTSESIRMHYLDEGQAGRPIVCVHGNPTWSFYYRSIARSLSPSRRVIAVDHVGCGMSDKPQNYPYCLDTHTANLVQLIEKLDLEKITLVVHDWGGAIGLGAAVQLKERMSQLVILNTAAFPPPYIPWRISACRIPVVGNWAMRGLNLFARAALTMTLNRLPKLTDDVAAGLIAPYDNWANRVAIARFVQDIPTHANQPTYQTLQRLEQQLPTLDDLQVDLVWGMKDWCFRPECLERFQKHLPRAQVTRLDDVGHYVMEEAPEEVLRVLESTR